MGLMFDPDLCVGTWGPAMAAVMDLLVSENGEWIPADQINAVAGTGLLGGLRRYGAVNVRLRGCRINAYAATTLGIAWWTTP
jgi:hypothetical protein